MQVDKVHISMPAARQLSGRLTEMSYEIWGLAAYAAEKRRQLFLFAFACLELFNNLFQLLDEPVL